MSTQENSREAIVERDGQGLTVDDATTITIDITDPPQPPILLAPPVVGTLEQRFVLRALESGWVAPVGPDLTLFEQEVAEVTGMPHAVALASGTAALHLALELAGVGPGDTVILPTLTFIASAAPVVHLGAEPVFMDVDPASWTLDAHLLEEELARRDRVGKLPKAVVVVDLFGQTADYDAINAVCRRHGVAVIADAAESLGASNGGRPAGSLTEMGCLSFNGNKIITTSGGGMLLTRDAEHAEHARALATHARQPVAHYEHFEIGHNFRLSNILAALGRAQLRSLDDRIAHRRRVNELYRSHLQDEPGIAFMPEAPWGRSNHWLTALTIDADRFGATRETVRLHLQRHGVEARPIWKPMHRQPVFTGATTVGGAVSEQLFGRGLCLPSGYGLEEASVRRIADLVASARRS